MQRKRAVLAEDEPNIVVSLEFLLGRAGFEVDVKSNGRQALDAIMEAPPAIVVLDVMLPEIDGFEVLNRVRQKYAADSLPVIMLTAKGQREDRERALEAGANLFISKPFSNADLIQAVTELTGGVSAGVPLGAATSHAAPDTVP